MGKNLVYDDWKNIKLDGNRKTQTIYLFRHAQTHFNRKKYFTGWMDSKLTPFGKEQAKLVAQKLKSKKIDVAFQTHLSRSSDTLGFVLKFHPECKYVFTDDRMIERSYGNFSGSSHKAFAKKFGEKALQTLRRSYSNRPPKGENMPMVEKRVNSFLKDLIPFMKYRKINVAISAHGNSMRPFRAYFEKLARDQMMRLENPWDDYFEYVVK
ncbi:histidine phosphatase family protein [Candidatus Micrarchaeota archaeon]|nr:histidine phosphatase family protein [Candidatus Micrarchaeota archaeon]